MYKYMFYDWNLMNQITFNNTDTSNGRHYIFKKIDCVFLETISDFMLLDKQINLLILKTIYYLQ